MSRKWILIIIVLVIVVGVIAFGFFAIRKAGEHGSTGGSPFSQFGQEDCKSEFTKFGASPLKIEDINYIEPMGAMAQDHVLPTDHGYFRPIPWDQEPIPRDVRAPGDGYIVKIERQNYQSPGRPPTQDHNVIIEYSCNVKSEFIHVTEFSDRIVSEIGELKPGSSKRVRVSVSEGETIGQIKLLPELDEVGLYQLDFSVTDDGKFVNFYDYFEESIKSQLLSKNLRSEAPLAGDIYFDQPGKIVGSWAKEGTIRENDVYLAQRENKLAIVYDYIDPTQIRISIGDYNGQSKQFGVKGNSPDPADVGDSQQVKYELVGFDYYQKDTSDTWDRKTYAPNLISRNYDNFVEGTILLKLLENSKLKVEVFPGKTADQVTGFSSLAKIYQR